MTLDLHDADERLLIAVDGPAAFVGLERPDGLFQFVATSEPSGGTRTFVIGGQEAHIDLRNLVDVTTAAAVAKEWFERGEDSLHGHWERK